jgi:PTH1 family peptidyl-tRNA hydrolase
VRVKKGGGSAGHNGLRSMDRTLGSHDYWRVRLGIGHPGVKEHVLAHVLGNFSREDKPWLIVLLDAVADAAGLLAERKHPDFMSNVAWRTRAPSSGTLGGGPQADRDIS